MQAARRQYRAVQDTLQQGLRSFAAPLILLITALTVLLGWASWHAIGHQPTILPAWVPGMTISAILGFAGLLLLFERWQQGRLAETRALKADLLDRASRLRDAIERSAAALARILFVDLVCRLKAALDLPPQARPGVQHTCLTPRLLAQRPQVARVSRG